MKYQDDLMRERIQKLMHREGMTQGDFAKKIGRRQANISQILTGERNVPKNLGNEIIAAFPNINRDWLYFGEGTMYSDETKTIDFPLETRPRLPKSVAGGHLADYYEGEKRALCQEKPIITQFTDYDFSLILKNNRMSPKYDRGDELFFKKSTIIEWGNDYLIDTSEGPKFKKIYDDKESVKCVSYNKEEYPEFLVPKDLIYGYYRLVGVLRIL